MTRDQLEVLSDEILLLMPKGPALYPEGITTDESQEDRIAEMIREAALEGVRDELPHSIAVVIDDIAPREGTDLTDVHASIVVERDSQKAIIIGHKGKRLSEVGARARVGIEALIGTRAVSYTHLRAQETKAKLVSRLLLEKKNVNEP